MAIFTYQQRVAIYKRIEERKSTKYKSGQVKKINRDKKGNIIL